MSLAKLDQFHLTEFLPLRAQIDIGGSLKKIVRTFLVHAIDLMCDYYALKMVA